MVCNQCGNNLQDHNNFCEHCQQYVRPISITAFNAQEESKNLKDLPDDGNSDSSSNALIASLRNPKNRILTIITLIAIVGCIILSFFSYYLYSTLSNYNNNSLVVSQSDDLQDKNLVMVRIGSEQYGYTTVPESWINAVYDNTNSGSLPSIQYVSLDGKYSVTLSKSYKSSVTLSSCAENLQKMMIDHFNVENNEKEEIVKISKTTVNEIPAYLVSGTYNMGENLNCTISSYLMMDENDMLYMMTVASYNRNKDLNYLLENFSFEKPESD